MSTTTPDRVTVTATIPAPDGPTVTVRIVNTYETGWSSDRDVEVPAPADGTVEDWWEDVVWPETGDESAPRGVGSHYQATVLTAPDGTPVTSGDTREWVG